MSEMKSAAINQETEKKHLCISKKPDQTKHSTLCFGGHDWWYHNRAHVDFQLMRRYAKIGPVLYINSIVMQKVNISHGINLIKKVIRKVKSITNGLKEIDTNFWVYSPFSLPVQHISLAKPTNETLLRFQIGRVTRKLHMFEPVVWVVCPTACDIAIKMQKVRMVYLRTDVYELFPNVDPQIISRYDRKLKEHADLTIFVSKKLFEDEHRQCRNPYYLDHGVDYEMFASMINDDKCLPDIASLKKPIVGYFGSIDKHTVDIEMIDELTDLLPEMTFVFVGPIDSEMPSFVSKKNVQMLGQKPYERIPYYGKNFSVAIMPWRNTEWIRACNPIKLKEYLALGKPVVSTPFPELEKYLDVVYMAKTPKKFAEQIRTALAEDGPDRIAARKKKVQSATWNSKAQLVLEELFKKEEAI